MWRTQHSAQSTNRRRRGNLLLASVPWLATILLTAASGQSAKLPRFQDHSVSSVYHGEVKPPDFGNPDQYDGTDLRCFGGDPAEYAKGHANFAGHFVIGRCTCGSGCHYLFMWDGLNGKFYRWFPFGPINVGPYGLGSTVPPVGYKGEQFRVDSTLLIVEGCIEGTCDCATRYYNWNGGEFKLILSRASRKPPRCSK
jgi:hypothetical protein